MNSVQAFFRSFFTEHLLAKFFALLFGAVTVYLIDRDISSLETWESKRFVVRLAKDDEGASDKTSIRFLIEVEPNIWVGTHGGKISGQIEARISGPKNREDDFREDPVIRIRLSQERVPDDLPVKGPPSILLTADDFDPSIDGVEVELLEDFRIYLDKIEARPNFAMALSEETRVPGSQRINFEDTEFKPKTTTVRGPRHQLKRFNDSNPIVVIPIESGVLTENKPYDVEVEDATLSIKLNPGGKPPQVILAVKNAAESSHRLGLLPIYWNFSEDSWTQINSGKVAVSRALDFTEVQVTITGPPRVLAPYLKGGAKAGKLRSLIRIAADPNDLIRRVLKGSQEEKTNLIALGIPEGLKAKLDPPTIRITIKRKDADNK